MKQSDLSDYQYSGLEQRFWEKVDRGNVGECWEWQAARGTKGYGQFWNGEYMDHAHRISYALDVREPGDLHVLHTCDNPPCVNPNHLYLGTNSDNQKDAFERGQKTHIGEQNPSAKLTKDDVIDIKEMLDGSASYSDVMDEYDIGKTAVGQIARGETWTHVD